MRLSFTIDAQLRTVRGAEHLEFTPDLPITELVFRLTANSSYIVQRGSKVVVDSATSDHAGGKFRFTRAAAAASTQGGLLHIPLRGTVAAGMTVSADIAFTVTLGGAYYERLGRSGGFSWFASAQPLLAWQQGVGWHTEDMIPFPAETATSEAMDTDLSVTAPSTDTVIMTGDPTTPTGSGAIRTWQARTAAARDVSVAVGPFSVSDTAVDGVRLRVGSYTRASRDDLVPKFRRAISELAARLGAFPFPSLSVARVPGNDGGGIEYPAMIQMQSESVTDAVHETAHQWFYALVGNSQALDPWLDEAFAEYAERLVDDRPEPTAYLHDAGTVGRSIESYGTDENGYFFVTYAKGAAALEAARDAAGHSNWDTAIRCYIRANAWTIAGPDDLLRSIRQFPRAVAILRTASALK